MAILHDREAKVEIIDFDPDPYNDGVNYGHYQVSIGDAGVNSSFFDVLPFEDSSGTDNGQGQGDHNFGKDGNKEMGSVSLVEPDADELIFDPRGWVTNGVADFTESDSGAIEYVFVNKRDADDAWSVLIFRGGMVRMEATKGRKFSSNTGGTSSQSTQ